MKIKHHRRDEEFEFDLDSIQPSLEFEGLYDFMDYVAFKMDWDRNNYRLKDTETDVIENELSDLDNDKVYELWPMYTKRATK